MIKVLFVDDEVLAMEYLQNLIRWEEHGFQVVGHARSGRQAIDLFQRERPEIVISDIKMIRMDGLELSRQLKQFNPEVLIILLSAYRDFDYAKKGIEYGVSTQLLRTLDETEEGIRHIAEITLTADNLLVLYGIENISSSYDVKCKIGQMGRKVVDCLSEMEDCRFSLVCSGEIRKSEISSAFQRISGQADFFW